MRARKGAASEATQKIAPSKPSPRRGSAADRSRRRRGPRSAAPRRRTTGASALAAALGARRRRRHAACSKFADAGHRRASCASTVSRRLGDDEANVTDCRVVEKARRFAFIQLKDPRRRGGCLMNLMVHRGSGNAWSNAARPRTSRAEDRREAYEKLAEHVEKREQAKSKRARRSARPSVMAGRGSTDRAFVPRRRRRRPRATSAMDLGVTGGRGSIRGIRTCCDLDINLLGVGSRAVHHDILDGLPERLEEEKRPARSDDRVLGDRFLQSVHP